MSHQQSTTSCTSLKRLPFEARRQVLQEPPGDPAHWQHQDHEHAVEHDACGGACRHAEQNGSNSLEIECFRQRLAEQHQRETEDERRRQRERCDRSDAAPTSHEQHHERKCRDDQKARDEPEHVGQRSVIERTSQHLPCQRHRQDCDSADHDVADGQADHFVAVQDEHDRERWHDRPGKHPPLREPRGNGERGVEAKEECRDHGRVQRGADAVRHGQPSPSDAGVLGTPAQCGVLRLEQRDGERSA